METSVQNPKEAAGRRAAELIEDGMRVGLGTGSTVYYTLARLAERIEEEGLALRCVPTSLDTEAKAQELGIPLQALDDVEQIDLTIDGADEIDGDFNMTKGGGGALLREKVVAYISKREAIVVTRPKLVERLGTTFLLPVEVAPFARPVVAREIRRIGADPILRQREPGISFVTDNENEILDCKFPDGIADPAAMERELDAIPGVVETGLFIGLAHVVVIGDEDGTVEVREKKS
ncbi:MAG: ribose-5-phosphate isomerase RpiA [bacterium]|nr:ribose-5-phosphate isomerase RpiA [bacterium]